MASSAEEKQSITNDPSNTNTDANTNTSTSDTKTDDILKNAVESLSLDQRVPESQYLGKADDSEVKEITSLFTKWLIEDNGSKKPPQRKQSHALKVHLNNSLTTKSADPLTLLKRRGKQPKVTNGLDIHQNTGIESAVTEDVLKFDDLLGLVNEIEKDHLLKLKERVYREKKRQQEQSNKDHEKLRQIVHAHFKESRGLVKKIGNIKHRKKRKRARKNEPTKRKGKRYQARYFHKQSVKNRKKKLRRQSLHLW